MGAFDDWVGREETLDDVVGATPAHLLAATLDRAATGFRHGDVLPPGWHWLYALRAVRTSDVGSDGHPPKGGFLPPVALPRRMRAGGEFVFHAPLRIGDTISRRSRIESVEEKHGGSGPLTFVRVRHDLLRDGAPALTEHETLVYREATAPGAPRPAAPSSQAAGAATDETATSRYLTSEVMLFRFSALTFNGHRIHYDRDYATRVEGYPGLVVHGPLVALLLLEHLASRGPQATLRRFTYRAIAPLFCGETITIGAASGAAAGSTRVVARGARGVDAVVGDAWYDG